MDALNQMKKEEETLKNMGVVNCSAFKSEEKHAQLEIRHLSMVFDGQEAVNDVSFDVNKGEFLSILGPSGCGKTTILRMLIGLLMPTSGKIFMNGEDISTLPASKRKMGIVFQNFALFENMSVLGNVEYALRIKRDNSKTRKESKAIAREKARSLIEKMGLKDFEKQKPVTLSGGQQQRVAIARTQRIKKYSKGIRHYDDLYYARSGRGVCYVRSNHRHGAFSNKSDRYAGGDCRRARERVYKVFYRGKSQSESRIACKIRKDKRRGER